jgi:hypothetical protein
MTKATASNIHEVSPATEGGISSTADLRAFLLEQMRGVVRGEVTDRQVENIVSLCDQVTKTLALEVRVAESGKSLGDHRSPSRLALL